MREIPCGVHATCLPDKTNPERKYRCACIKGYKGNPYSNGKDKCKNKEELYLEKLFGYHKCQGCKFVRALRSLFRDVKDLRILDFGTGSCQALRAMLKMEMNATGVESASFPLEDNCPDLLHSGVALKSKLDDLPFGNSTFDVVFVSHVLEYMPKDILDDVISEIARVSKLHVFLALQTPPDDKKKRRSHVVDGLEVESYFSNLWWRERLAAGGLDLMDIETHMYLEHAKKKAIKFDNQEVVMVLGTEPPEDSREFPLIHKVYCLACDYMPLVSYMYSPPITVSQSRYKKKLTMGYTMVLGPSSCNVMRGLLENPPSSLKKTVGLQPVPYTISRDCPDLFRQRLVLTMPPAKEQLPFKDGQADLILSLFHLELMTEDEIELHLAELRRVSNHRVLFLIHTCGSHYAASNCLANFIPGIQTSQPRTWWVELLERNGFEMEEVGHAFQKRRCEVVDKVNNSSRMGFCSSPAEEFSASSTYHLQPQDIFSVSIKNSTRPEDQESGDDIGGLIKAHKAEERETFAEMVDVEEFAATSESFEVEVKMSKPFWSKHQKAEQKMKDRLKKLFPNGAPPAPRTAHIYRSRGYNIKAENQNQGEENE